MCALLVLPGCGSWSNLAKGSAIGSGAGAAAGALAGYLIGKDAKSSAIGAAVGTAVGVSAGAVIGAKMDKKARELSEIEGAKVDTLTDANNLKAIKVTFESGILFATNGYTLNDASKASLSKFASTMNKDDIKETNMLIQGHTDNTGADEYNQKLSVQRAESVATYLEGQGVSSTRITSEGKSYSAPVADNSTVEGRKQNRRVEVYIYANEDMIKSAEATAENSTK